MNLTKPPLDSPHTVNLLPTLRFSPEWKALYWITVTALLAAKILSFWLLGLLGLITGDIALISPWLLVLTVFALNEIIRIIPDEVFPIILLWIIPITVIALHILYIIALPIAAYAKSARMIHFALYAFAGSMIMPFLYSFLYLVTFLLGGWLTFPPIMLILSAPLVLLYSNKAIIHKQRQAFQKTFRVVVIITLLSTVVYFFLVATLFETINVPFIETQLGIGAETSNLFDVSSSSVIFNFLFGGFGHVPLLAMVIVWKYLDTNRFNSILRIFTTAATIAVLGVGYSYLSRFFFSFDYLNFFLFTLPGFISIFFITRVALRSVTTVHPFISPFGYPIFKVLGPKPTPHRPNKPTLGAKILADYRDKSLFHLDENEEPQKR